MRPEPPVAGAPKSTFARRKLKITVDPAYPRVDHGHIVPETYQRNFAAQRQVIRHELGTDAAPELRNVRTVCRRGPFYRRQRPDGTFIDDTEASMARIENLAGLCFRRIRETGSVERDDKAVLAEFFGLQLVRSPTFFDVRAAGISETLQSAPDDRFNVDAVVEHGSIDAVREKVAAHYLGSTARSVSMIGSSTKVAASLANMHWTLLRFQQPVLVYSDHPVVVWPASCSLAEGFRGQQFAPVDAVEVRIPLTSSIFLLLTWSDSEETDLAVLDVGRYLAGELNQLTIGQAELEWAHAPGTRPPVARSGHEPLAPRLWPSYTADKIKDSIHRHHVQRWLHEHRHRDRVPDFPIFSVTRQAPQVRRDRRRGERR